MSPAGDASGATIDYRHLRGVSPSGQLLAGALLGFLVFNFHPARIFMGDSGSLIIGAILYGLTHVFLLPLQNDWIYLWLALAVTPPAS